MDSNPWSLLYIETPLNLCGLQKKYIRLFGRRASVLFVLLCRSRVCRYIFGRLRFLYFVVSSTSWNYELQWKIYMWIDIYCECWHEFHGISFNISYIIRTLELISLEFRLIAGMNFSGEFRRNFFSLLYVGWALTWISLELLIRDCCLSACTNLLENLRRAWHAVWALSTWIVEYLYMKLWLFVWILSTLWLMNLIIVLGAVSLHPWPGLTFICTECGVYLRRWNEMCLSCDWCVNIGCVLFHILPWYHILHGMTRVLCCIFIFVLFTLTMSRIRKLTDKGRKLLARNIRGKCASGFRSGNAVINKLVPLLKDNMSSVEQVTEYISNLEHHMSSIVQSYSEFNEKFAGDLDTLADFHKWFNPRYDALQSVLQYSRDWVQNVHFQEGVDKDISALNVPDFQDDHDDIQPEDSASQVTPQPESGCSSNKTSRSRGSSVRSARVQESLKKVALTAQVNSLKQKQELMRKELELTMQKESLELTTNLAIATAKEEVLLDVELAKEFSVLSHDKTHPVSLHVSQSERSADTSPSVHVDNVHLSVPSNLTSTSVRPAVTVNTVRSQIGGGGPAIVVGQDVNITSSDLSVHQSILSQLSDAQSVSHTDLKTVTRTVPDIVSDRVSVATSHFTDGMPTQSRRSDAGEFTGGSQQRSEDLGHHGVSTTHSPCHGTRMTVAFDDNVAQVHNHSDLYHSRSVTTFSATPVMLPTGSTSTPIDSHNGLNPASPVFIPAMRGMQANGAGDFVHCSDVVCPRSGFQEQSPGVVVMAKLFTCWDRFCEWVQAWISLWQVDWFDGRSEASVAWPFCSQIQWWTFRICLIYA